MNHDSDEPDHTQQEIAIVAMAGRFPGAENLDRFWANLRGGVESIRFFSDEELLAAGVAPDLLRNPAYVRAGGVLADADRFDAAFFGFSPREAEILDPQQRLFLECAWEALEAAGYGEGSGQGLVGIFAGTSYSQYLLVNLLANREVLERIGSNAVALGNDKDYLATRVAYKLDLRGPSLTVQTACSTSLVAVHLACQSLLNGECDLALAGGVSIAQPQIAGYFYEKQGILSPDGHCRAFDARAQGTVPGRGMGVVVLRRLADALRDGDRIRAVIKGSAINNDGSARVGYTAPGVEGQSEVIAETLGLAGVDPETITYIETHGTGTELGDPIEIEALIKAFQTNRRGFCALGSLKTNIGHLDAAAGVAGLIKAVLCLEQGEIPPSLHFEHPNPRTDLARSPFFVNAALRRWEAGATPRRAGVSSFGLGGTNAHLILEEAPPREPSGASRPWQLLTLSAKTPAALETATDRFAEHLRHNPDIPLADVAFTGHRGRRAFEHRRVLICRGAEEAASALENRDPKRVLTRASRPGDRPLAFLFPGLGDHHAGMAAGLYREEPVFREELDSCCEILKPLLGLDLRELLYPQGSAEPDESVSGRTAGPDLRRLLAAARGGRDEAPDRLDRTLFAHPALFSVEYALARLWISWGIKPQAMLGYSLGEYVAACLAGVCSLQDALTLVTVRAELIDRLPAGAMVAVGLPEGIVTGYLDEHLSLSAVNGPDLCVLAGPVAAIEELERRLAREEVPCRRLRTAHAFHSRMMDPIARIFAAKVRAVTLRPPEVPFVSNVTGTWISAAEATDPDYWVRHLCRPVLFGRGCSELWRAPGRILLEVGPGQSLTSLALQHQPPGEAVAVSCMRPSHEPGADLAFQLNALGQLWLAGVEVGWEGFHAGERRHRVALPTYPFERQRYWVESAASAGPPAAAGRSSLTGKGTEIADWFFAPGWRVSEPPPAAGGQPGSGVWLVLHRGHLFDLALIDLLKARGTRVVTARPAEDWARLAPDAWTLRPAVREDWDRLLADLREAGLRPSRIAHLWSLLETPEAASDEETFARAQQTGYYSLLFLAQALAAEPDDAPLKIAVVTDRVADVSGQESIEPEKATLLGLCKVIPQEHSQIACQCIDVRLPPAGGPALERLAEQVAEEIDAESRDVLVSWRGSRRWVEAFQPLRLSAEGPGRRRLRPGGVYLVLGGLGGIGLRVAGYLAEVAGARLALVGRSSFPPREEWEAHLAGIPPNDPVGRRISRLLDLEAKGAEILVLSADLAREDQVRAAVAASQERFGALHGVFHCAGVTRGPSLAPLVSLGVEESEVQLAVKGYGLYALERVLEPFDLDFCFLFSSASATLGGLGLAAYSAASLFLDAFAQSRNTAGRGTWLTSDWDPWPGEETTAPGEASSSVEQYMMTSAEAIEAFRRVLCKGPGHVVVVTGDLEARIDIWLRRSERFSRHRHASQPRRALSNPYVAARNETERIVAEVWEEQLGIAPVGIHDNFFHLGGHSLMGMRLRSRLEEIFQIDLPMAMVLQAPTVADIAVAIEVALIEDLTADGLAS